MDENPITKFDINDESENIKLPPINLKLIPPQKNINDLSKNENEDEKKLKYIRSQTFITSKKTETERFEEVKSKNLISNEAISDLLKEKIEINNTLNYDRIIIDNFYKTIYLQRWMNLSKVKTMKAQILIKDYII